MKTVKKYYYKYDEIFNYLFFGFVTTVVCLFVYYLLVCTILDPNNGIQLQIANILSWIVGVIIAYITNRKYVFKSSNSEKKKEFVSFVVARIFTLVLDMLIMGIGVSILKLNDKIIKIISQIVVIVANYLLSKILIFKKDKTKKI